MHSNTIKSIKDVRKLGELATYNLCITSNINNVRITVNELLHIIKNYPSINDRILFELKVILNEILINAINHGNKGDEKKFVKIEMGFVDDTISISVEDEGKGYCYSDACELRKPICENSDFACICEDGRGIMIIKGLCDKVEVSAAGNRITIYKRISVNHDGAITITEQ